MKAKKFFLKRWMNKLVYNIDRNWDLYLTLFVVFMFASLAVLKGIDLYLRYFG